MFMGIDISFIWPVLLSALPTIIAGGAFVGLMWWLSKSSSAVFKANYLGLAIQAVRWVEVEFENNPNPTINKADMALKKFIDLYTAHTDAAPSEALKLWFNVAKEEILVDLAKAQMLTPSAPVVPLVVPVPTAVPNTPSV